MIAVIVLGALFALVVAAVVELTPFLVQVSCDHLGFFKLGSEVARRQVSKRRMRPVSIVVDPPVDAALACVGHR